MSLIHTSIKNIAGHEIKISIKSNATIREFYELLFNKLPFENSGNKIGVESLMLVNGAKSISYKKYKDKTMEEMHIEDGSSFFLVVRLPGGIRYGWLIMMSMKQIAISHILMDDLQTYLSTRLIIKHIILFFVLSIKYRLIMSINLTIKSVHNSNANGIRITVDPKATTIEQFFKLASEKLGVDISLLILVYAGKPLKLDDPKLKGKSV